MGKFDRLGRSELIALVDGLENECNQHVEVLMDLDIMLLREAALRTWNAWAAVLALCAERQAAVNLLQREESAACRRWKTRAYPQDVGYEDACSRCGLAISEGKHHEN